MKYLIAFAVLAISMRTIVSQGGEGVNVPAENPGENVDPNPADKPAENPDDNAAENPDDNADPNPAEPPAVNSADGNADTNPADKPAEDPANDDAGSDKDQTGSESENPAPTSGGSGGETQATPEDTTSEKQSIKDKVIAAIGIVPKCRDKFAVCYGNDSEVEEIRGKVIDSIGEDDLCDYLNKGEDCLTAMKDNLGCTGDEFDTIKDIVCSASRGAVVSLVLIGLLSFISSMISQH